MEQNTDLDGILGKRVVAYSVDSDSELALKFEDETILQWWGYQCTPTNPDEQDIRDVVDKKLSGTWVEADSTSD